MRARRVHVVLLAVVAVAFTVKAQSGCPFRNVPNGASTSSNVSCGSTVTSCPPNALYRSYDGSCNNLWKPNQGSADTRYARLLPAKYGDGISTPTLSKNGTALPNARNVSLTVFPDMQIEDTVWTLMTMQYGQFVSHDLSLLIDPAIVDDVDCCSDDGQFLSDPPDNCYPIVVPSDDPPFNLQNITCLPLARSVTDRDRHCPGTLPFSPAQQLSSVTHYLDLSLVYGNSEETDAELRTFSGGKLETELLDQGEMLPLADDDTCTNVPCYFAGDSRANQNPELTLIHTIFVREHNRLATKLAELNPHWCDEKLFQEARKINIAQHQYITFYEWLPIIVGSDQVLNYSVTYNTTEYVDDYNPFADISVYNEFSTAAFRFFHSQIAGQLDLMTEDRNISSTTRISNYWNRVVGILNSSFVDLTRGLCTQAEMASDIYHDKEITLYWLRRPNATIGRDLQAIGIQRNRDHGLASYNDLRELCGLDRATSFDDFADVINQTNVDKLASLYNNPDDVDLAVGVALETLLNNILVGPTIRCILTKQFLRTRVADRFFFENSGPTGFTLDQLNSIRSITVAKLVCQNVEEIKEIQPQGFKLISSTNALTPCSNLTTVDLTLWEEAPCSTTSTTSETTTSEITTSESTTIEITTSESE